MAMVEDASVRNYRPLFVIDESGLRKYADKPLIAEMPEQGGAPAAVAREVVASASSRRRTKRGRRELRPDAVGSIPIALPCSSRRIRGCVPKQFSFDEKMAVQIFSF
jgi:hypothetical protein